MLGHTTILGKFKKIEIISSIFSDHNIRRLEIQTRREKLQKYKQVEAKQYAGEGNGDPLQYFCLENPMDGGAWKAEVHGVTEGRTRLSDFTFTFTHSREVREDA